MLKAWDKPNGQVRCDLSQVFAWGLSTQRISFDMDTSGYPNSSHRYMPPQIQIQIHMPIPATIKLH